MAIDFAELAIRTKYDEVEKATQALDKLTAAGAKAEQSTNRVGVSSIAQTRNMGAWAAIQAEAAGHVGEHSIAIGRLERAIASYVGHAVGAGAATESLVAGLLKFSIGTLETVGVLGGLAAIVGLYELVTAGARKAREESDKLTDSFVSQARAARAATLQGADDLKLIQELNQQAVNKETGFGWRSAIMSAITGRVGLSDTDAENQASRRANAQTGVEQAAANTLKIWNDMEEKRTRKAEEEARKREAAEHKAQEDAIRYRELLDRSYGHLGEVGHDFSGGPIAQQLALATQNSRLSVLQALQSLNVGIPNNAMPNVSINDGLTKEMVRQREKMGIFIEDANKNAEKLSDVIFNSAMDSANIIVSALNLGGGGRGSGIGGALGQSAGAAAGFYFGGPAGAEIGGTLGGIVGSLFGGLFDHAKAAREAAKAQRSITLELEQIQARLAHNKLSETLLGIEAQLQATIASFNAALPGRQNEGLRNADIAQAQALAAKQEQQARDEYARNQKYAGEDLAIRNLRALGRGDEASLLAFKEGEERELTQAIQDGRDATYQNNLITTQNNELLAYQNGLLSDALRNAPTGFFASRYYSDYASPRGSPSDPFGTGMLPPNYPTGPAGTGPASGSGLTPPGNRAPLNATINLTVDGRVLTSVVVRNLDQVAASTGGAGTSRSDALDRMPA